ncbi:MAG: hypothetical protein QOF21_171 [Actinomycetota bacterium]|jgi:Ser/Thr protein kinase RdoA (MazF antagonist)
MQSSLVSDAFALGSPRRELVEVARGAMGQVYRLETERGPFAVKRLFAGPTGGEDANAQLQFAAHAAGVPLPLPVVTDGGDLLALVGEDWWRAYEWVDGAICPFDAPAPVAAAAGVARSLGRLHALRHDEGGEVDGWFLGVDDSSIDAALAIAAAHGLDVAAVQRELPRLAAISRLPLESKPIGCHNDPDRGNVLVRTDGVSVLVDWDNAGPAYAECEFAGALFSWCYDDSPELRHETVEAMVHAYRETGATFAPNGLEVFATACSSWVQYTVMCCEHLADAGISAAMLSFERPIIDKLATFDETVSKLERILDMVPA